MRWSKGSTSTDGGPSRDVGFKALAVNLSDLAAMGAAPALALLSLVLPAGSTLADLDAILDGFLELAAGRGGPSPAATSPVARPADGRRHGAGRSVRAGS